MFCRNVTSRYLHLVLVVALLLHCVTPALYAQDTLYLPLISSGENRPTLHRLFRTSVTVQTAAQWQTLARLSVVTLTKDDDSALLLVDDEQLTELARLRFNPTETNAVVTLAEADHALAAHLQPLLSALAAVERTSVADAVTRTQERASLHTMVQSLTATQLTALTTAASADSDNDGLTDDQESFWCTDPARADSDFDGTKDGAEVTALKAWMNNQRAQFPSTGKPFQGWPPQKQNCFDDDQDAVPDLAESLELGLNPGRESTDRDKFDDGQELFGQTYCTGQGGFCSYGPLPRNEDWGVIFAEMPSWVKAPGNHPLVAGFPVPEIDVVQSSLHVETVTTVTTDHTISSGTEKSYSTGKTEGTSTSVANAETWNNWQESFESKEEIAPLVAANLVNNSDIYASRIESTSLYNARTTLHAECQDVQKMMGSSDTHNIGVEGSTSALAPVTVSAHYDYSQETNQGITTSLNPELAGRKCKAAIAQFCAVAGPNDPYCLPDSASNIKLTEDSRLTVKIADMDNLLGGLSGIQLAQTQSGQLLGLRLSEIAYAIAAPKRTTGSSSGTSRGGSRTVTNEAYEEHTITNGEAFSTEESWGTATAIDSAHAADLWFSYKVRNTGTEYAREIANLAFNVYIGDDPNPAMTYFVAPDIGGNGKFQNFMPNEEHSYTSRRIPLSLNQMRTVDLGGPIRVVVEDFTYGIDELFYQDATNAGVLVAVEDGTDDGDETIDTYLIPTWGQERVLNVLARYFPHETDADGTIIAIWTPEYRSDTPVWCQSPRRPTDFPNKSLWCKHALSTADWWNVYTDGLGDGSEGFQDTPAAPGSVALFRFNQDSDLDGFSDRSEVRLGTDPADAASVPHPKLLAGVHSIKAGNKVTSTLSLLNTGIYDAYGVEAVMVAPDDSISITNNTVGGSGRVRALKQVIVGSSLQLPSPLPGNWTQAGHALPAVGGYYTGNTDRTYTLTINCSNPGGCTIGSGSWSVNWRDGLGASGVLNFGDGYKSPTFLPVGNLGVTVAFYSGKVSNGESIAVTARTPRDTFQYTINREPYTPPLVIVSYNDPQGNHRFVIPPPAMNLTAPTDNLNQFAGIMLQDVGVEIVTNAPFAAGANSAKLLVNNPADKTLSNARLFLEVINISGTVVSEIPTQVTLPPGPTYTTVNFNTNSFNPAYNADEDYIVMAFLTDYQGNILDTAGRPLSSFQVDPLPTLVADEASLTWNFGTVQQGTLLKHQLSIANTGFGRLYTYVPPASGLTLHSSGQTIGAADLLASELTLRTADLPLGAYDQTIAIATSDPTTSARTLHVLGTITAPSGDTPGGAVQRPLDVPVTVTGSHSQGEWFDFMHTLGPDPQSLHPVKVYSQDYGTLYGVSKYATNFGQGTASYDMFGDGRDGNLAISSDTVFSPHDANISGVAGSTTFTLSNKSAGFVAKAGDTVFIHQTRGVGSGHYQRNTVLSYNENTLTLKNPLTFSPTHSPSHSDPNKAQVIVVPQYENVTVSSGTRYMVKPWDGFKGGILVFQVHNLTVDGSLDCSGGDDAESQTSIGQGRGGFRGGRGGNGGSDWGTVDGYNANPNGEQGESYLGLGGVTSSSFNGGGGGGGVMSNSVGGNGGGGSYGGYGYNGDNNVSFTPASGGSRGDTYGSPDLAVIHLGSGGGGGAASTKPGGEGGGGIASQRGGGIFVGYAKYVVVNNTINCKGGDVWQGLNNGNIGTGGGGSGGSVLLIGQNVAIGTNRINVAGGKGGANNSGTRGGDGGVGRIRIDYCETLDGTTNPPASAQKLNCYITEQVESAPYTNIRLNLPETFANGRTYNVQFGRKLDFAAVGNQLTQVRVPAGMVSSAKVDLLASGLAANANITIDIGDDGTVDWSGTVANNSSTTSPELSQSFNAYWAAHGAPATGTLDLPVRITSSGAGQFLLTNLQLASAASSVRSIRLPVQTYTQFLLDFTAGFTGSVVATLDIGDNGSIDWRSPAAGTAPMRWQTGDVKAALNNYLNGKSGLVDVPIRFYISPFGSVKLNDYTATYAGVTDLSASSITAGAVQASSAEAGQVNEGAIVPLQATLSNPSGSDSGPVTAAFFAHAEGWGDWYIGSSLLNNIAAGGSAQVSAQWNTTGFGSDKPVAVKVVVNPYGRLGESNLTNNSKTTNITVTPTKTTQTITFAPIADKNVGDASFAVTISASSGLAVSLTSLTPATCTVNGATVTVVGAGLCTLRAEQPGNAFFYAAAAVERTFTVNDPAKLTQTLQFTAIGNRKLSESPITLTASASSGLAVSFTSSTPSICTVSGNGVTLLAVGVCTLVAQQPGNHQYNAAISEQSFQVNPNDKLDQSITFNPLPDKTYGDAPFTVSGAAASTLAVSFAALTTSVCTVDANTVTLVAAGLCTIRALQTGDVTYNPAAPVERSFTVHKANQSILFGSLSDKLTTDAAFSISASASSGLSVAFTSQTLAVCTIAGNLVTLLDKGLCTIRGTQPGDGNYNAADSIDQSFVVRNPALTSQTLTFDPLPDKTLGDPSFTLNATASSGLAVSFVAQTPTVCNVEGATVSLLTVGLCMIQATQEGNEHFNPATPVTRAFQITEVPKERHQLYLPLAER